MSSHIRLKVPSSSASFITLASLLLFLQALTVGIKNQPVYKHVDILAFFNTLVDLDFACQFKPFDFRPEVFLPKVL